MGAAVASSSFQLRPYQLEAVQAVIEARRRGVRRPLLCLPTGAGKTVVFSELARRAQRPVLVLAHRQELVEQAVEKLARTLGSEAAIGIEQASSRAGAGARAVVASLRSLNEERLADLARWLAPGLVIYDECHHAPAEDNRRVLTGLGALEPDWEGTLLGVTATPLRGDGIPLGEVFEEIVYQKDLRSMIAEGWLCPLRGFRIETGQDLRGPSGDDPDAAEEQLGVDISERNDLVARSIQELARDRRTIVFCLNVRHAASLSRTLNAIGVPSGLVHGELDQEERRGVLARFREGSITALTNVGVLTEGFDDPGVSCIAMARPTRSPALYAQCVGRGVRPAEGKTDCLVLDFADVSDLPLVTLPALFGLPAVLDLAGEEVGEAAERFDHLLEQNPLFDDEELDAEEAITLAEIQARAEAFDPLSLVVDPEVRAISPFAWFSLGRRGLALWHEPKAGRPLLTLVQPRRGAGGRSWTVTQDGEERARFGSAEAAIEAVDYEVRRRGPRAASSAEPDARWRRRPIAPETLRRLQEFPTSRMPRDEGEAREILTFIEHGPSRRRRGRMGLDRPS